jgi:outer membrane protein assembly factor BamB
MRSSYRKNLTTILHLFCIAAVSASDPVVDAIDPAMDWPAWLGPYGTCTAIPSGTALVEELGDARLVWTSEEIPWGRAPDASDGCDTRVSGGQSSPIVYDGKVYLYYYVPGGVEYDREMRERCGEMDKWLIDADDVVLCVDAVTGETKWKRVYEGKGINYNRFNKGMPALTPVAAGGKVYAVGTGGRVYCMDAETGAHVWEKTLGKRFRDQEVLRARMHASDTLCSFNRDMLAPAGFVVEGVLVANDHAKWKTTNCGADYSRQHGVIALDAETGDSLWALPDGGRAARFVTGDEEYVVTTGGLTYDGTRWVQSAHGVEPRTGEILWTVDCGGPAVIGEGYLVGARDYYEGRFTCYRIDGIEVVKAWEKSESLAENVFPAIYRGHLFARLAGGRMACYDLASGEQKGETHYLTGSMGFIIAADGRLFSDSDESHGGGRIRMYNADPDSFVTMGSMWHTDAAGGYDIAIMPAVVDGRLFIRQQSALACYDLRVHPSAARPAAGPGACVSSLDPSVKHTSRGRRIALDLPTASFVECRVIDPRGRLAATPFAGQLPAGRHTLPRHPPVGSGTYIVHVQVNGRTARTRFITVP